MSTAYESTGRTRQKARTRTALLAAARELLAEGAMPTVEQAADRAAVSRTTAYRYFRNRRELVAATYPEIESGSLLDDDSPADPVERLDVVVRRITDQLMDHEPELRAQLRLALGATPEERARLPLRQGRAITWLEDALAPLRERLRPAQMRRLVLAIRATVGIEALVWLTDVAGLSRREAAELMRSSAHALVQAALSEDGERRPPGGGAGRAAKR